VKFQRKAFYVYNHFLTLVSSESCLAKEKTGFNIFYVMSQNTLQISYDVICEAVRIQEQRLLDEHKSKNQYLEVKVFLEGEKNKYFLYFSYIYSYKLVNIIKLIK